MGMLTGKTAVVTGSTSGIGLAYARTMAKAGANIVINGMGDADDIEKERKLKEQQELEKKKQRDLEKRKEEEAKKLVAEKEKEPTIGRRFRSCVSSQQGAPPLQQSKHHAALRHDESVKSR